MKLRFKEDVLLHLIPPQESSDIIHQLGNFFNMALGSLMIGSVFAQILVSQSLQVLWGFLNTQELIAHLPLYTLNLPANLYYLF